MAENNEKHGSSLLIGGGQGGTNIVSYFAGAHEELCKVVKLEEIVKKASAEIGSDEKVDVSKKGYLSRLFSYVAGKTKSIFTQGKEVIKEIYKKESITLMRDGEVSLVLIDYDPQNPHAPKSALSHQDGSIKIGNSIDHEIICGADSDTGKDVMRGIAILEKGANIALWSRVSGAALEAAGKGLNFVHYITAAGGGSGNSAKELTLEQIAKLQSGDERIYKKGWLDRDFAIITTLIMPHEYNEETVQTPTPHLMNATFRFVRDVSAIKSGNAPQNYLFFLEDMPISKLKIESKNNLAASNAYAAMFHRILHDSFNARAFVGQTELTYPELDNILTGNVGWFGLSTRYAYHCFDSHKEPGLREKIKKPFEESTFKDAIIRAVSPINGPDEVIDYGEDNYGTSTSIEHDIIEGGSYGYTEPIKESITQYIKDVSEKKADANKTPLEFKGESYICIIQSDYFDSEQEREAREFLKDLFPFAKRGNLYILKQRETRYSKKPHMGKPDKSLRVLVMHSGTISRTMLRMCTNGLNSGLENFDMAGFHLYVTGASDDTSFVKDDDVYSIGNRNDVLYKEIISTLKEKNKLLAKEEILNFSALVKEIYSRKSAQQAIPEF